MTDSHAAPTRSKSDGSEAEAAARRGRPVGDREAKRKELIAAAISVIARLGYAGASLRKVAQEAGYTTGAVTYYFANKEAMVTAILEHLFDEFDAMLKIGQEMADVKRRFQRFLDLNADSDLWIAQFQLLAQARHEPKFAAVYQRRYAQYRRTLSVMLERQQRAGDVRSDIPAELLADQLSAMGDGWMMMLPIEPERFEPARMQALLDSIVTLISPTPGVGVQGARTGA